MKVNNFRFFWHNQAIYDTYNSYSLLDEIKQLNFTKAEQEQYYDFIQKSRVEDYLIYRNGFRQTRYKKRIYDPCDERTF